MKRYRINITQTHLTALWVTARLINITPKALALALNSPSENHYRGYLNDLAQDGFLYKKPIYATADTGKSGMRLSTLYALTPRGNELLLESELIETDAYVYKKGIQAYSPFQTIHRIQVIQLLAQLLQLERLEKLKVLDMIPYFQKKPSDILSNKAQAGVEIDSEIIIPDALVRLELNGKIRVIAFELHRTTSTIRILEQLKKHTLAIEQKLFSQYFNETGFSFVCSIHENTSTLKNVIQRIRATEDFERFTKGFHFTSVEDLQIKGFTKAFYNFDEGESKLFSLH